MRRGVSEEAYRVGDVLDDVDERHDVELLLSQRRVGQDAGMHLQLARPRGANERLARLDAHGVEPCGLRLPQEQPSGRADIEEVAPGRMRTDGAADE